MGMFDYKHFGSEASTELMIISKSLAVYGNISGIMGIPTETILDKLGKEYLPNGFYPNKVDLALPEGWGEVAPVQLHMPDDAKDSWGFYPIESPITGSATSGPQAKIVEHRDENGQVDQISVVFAGTNSPVDLPDYFQINENVIAPNMNPLLEKVKEYAIENGLQGEDILITGYSLGGGMTNIMAKNREQLADGFFNSSKYIGHESPYIYDDDNVVLNMGFENDVVYRIIGDEANIKEAIDAGKPGLVNPDSHFSSTFDNIVLFNDIYASKIWEVSPFSILNIPVGWNAHVSGLMSDAVSRISESSFYEFTSRDSTVVVDALSGLRRWNTWVEDKATHTSDHYETPAFIIGTEHNDLLKGNIAGDYIDAGAGDDKIKLGEGADRLYGGEGTDTLILEGNSNDWEFFQYDESTYFINAIDGSGLNQVENIEQIQYEKESRKSFHNIDDAALEVAVIGTDGDNVLQGHQIFAGAGNDKLTAIAGTGNLLHGGEGNDILIASSGKNALYGAEGDDVLLAGSGVNLLSGGVGNDDFSFAKTDSNSVITDFNSYAGDNDQLFFAEELFADEAALSQVAFQSGDDVIIEYNQFNVTIENSLLDDVLAHCVIF